MSSDDLSPEDVAAALPGRPIRAFPALLSTEAEAMAWARAGGPDGGVVVADYQASARGRGGVEWKVVPRRSLGFSLVLRPDLPPEREGWLYVLATTALAHAAGEGARIDWPDAVRDGDRTVAAVGVQAGLAPDGIDWAVVSVLVSEPPGTRAATLRSVLEAIEERRGRPPDTVLAEHRARCATLGRRVRARLIPMGPAGPVIRGLAIRCKLDGTLVIETARGVHVAVRPQNLGTIDEDVADAVNYPPEIRRLLEGETGQGTDTSSA